MAPCKHHDWIRPSEGLHSVPLLPRGRDCGGWGTRVPPQSQGGAGQKWMQLGPEEAKMQEEAESDPSVARRDWKQPRYGVEDDGQ